MLSKRENKEKNDASSQQNKISGGKALPAAPESIIANEDTSPSLLHEGALDDLNAIENQTESKKLSSAREAYLAEKSEKSASDNLADEVVEDGGMTTETMEADEIIPMTRERGVSIIVPPQKVLQINFVNRVKAANDGINWAGLKVLSSYREIMHESASAIGVVADGAKKKGRELASPLELANAESLRKKGEAEKEDKIDAAGESKTPLQGNVEVLGEKVMTEEQKHELDESLTGPLLGILAAVELLNDAKDLISGAKKMDKLAAAQLLKNAAKASYNGLKAAHGIIALAGGPTISAFSTVVPGLGLVISTATIAVGIFQRWNAQEAVADMEAHEKQFIDLSPYFRNSKLFFSESRGALLSWHDYYRVQPTALQELGDAIAKSPQEQETIITKYKKNKINIPNKDIDAFIFRLNEYNLISKMIEINHKRVRHGVVAMASDIMVLAGNIAILVPGGQIAAGILHGTAGTTKAIVAASVSLNKILKNQNGFDGEKGKDVENADGFFGTAFAVGSAINEESSVKHAEYVMHTKQIMGMYAKIEPGSTTFDTEIEKVERIVNAAGVYPPAVYLETDSGTEGVYRSVHKIVGAMKSGR